VSTHATDVGGAGGGLVGQNEVVASCCGMGRAGGGGRYWDGVRDE